MIMVVNVNYCEPILVLVEEFDRVIPILVLVEELVDLVGGVHLLVYTSVILVLVWELVLVY